MGTTFLRASALRGSDFLISNFLVSSAIAVPGSPTLGTASTATAFSSGRLIGFAGVVCSLPTEPAFTDSVFGRFVLPPEVDFDLAIFGYSLHIPKFKNELSCSVMNDIHFAPQFSRDCLDFTSGVT